MNIRKLLVTGLLALATAGCAAQNAAEEPASGTAGLGAAPPTGGPSGAPTPTPAKTTTSPSPTPSGPRIVYFHVKQQPQCPQGTNVNPIPGVPLVVEWKLAGTDKAALSVDNPGLVGSYGTYAVEGSETFTFSCGGAPGSMEKHTYTIFTVGGGAERSKTLTVEAKVYEIAQV